jgi:hypothetical protein
MAAEPFTPDLFLGQFQPLDHRSHGAVEHQDAVFQQFCQAAGHGSILEHELLSCSIQTVHDSRQGAITARS